MATKVLRGCAGHTLNPSQKYREARSRSFRVAANQYAHGGCPRTRPRRVRSPTVRPGTSAGAILYRTISQPCSERPVPTGRPTGDSVVRVSATAGTALSTAQQRCQLPNSTMPPEPGRSRIACHPGRRAAPGLPWCVGPGQRPVRDLGGELIPCVGRRPVAVGRTSPSVPAGRPTAADSARSRPCHWCRLPATPRTAAGPPPRRSVCR